MNGSDGCNGIRNDFALGTVRRDWIELNLGQGFDPSFKDFVTKEILQSQNVPGSSN
jgi:hypothetical protein